MKRILMLALLSVFVTVAFAHANSGYGKGKNKQTATTESDAKSEDASKTKKVGKPVTLTGEVLDLYCYMQHPETSTGAEHAKCAKSCMAKGLPVGYMVNGKVYTIIGKDHQPVNAIVADYVGTKSTITGTVINHHGVNAIELATIAPAAEKSGKGTKQASTKPDNKAKMYTCSMHPEVHADKPGTCPKCGMDLVPMAAKEKGEDGEKDDEKDGEKDD